MQKKNIKNKLCGIIAIVVMVIAILPHAGITDAHANAAGGIKNNGLNGISININASPYTDFANISTWGRYAYTNVGCAWFASARVKQLTGKGSTIWSGASWWNNGNGRDGFLTGREPRAKALACYQNHVSVVEAVNGNTITISEGGRTDVSDYYGHCAIQNFSRSFVESNRSGAFLGYVYLTTTPTPVTVSWTGEKVVQNISPESVLLGERIRASASGHWTEPGVAYYRVGHPEEYREYIENFSWDGTYINITEDLIRDAHFRLEPGINYQYVLFAKYNETRYTSSIRYFTMKGNHTHSYTESITKQPSCTENGIKTLTCTVCGYKKTQEIAATGHKWDSGMITTQPTGSGNGVKTYTCTICGQKKTEEIAPTGVFTVSFDSDGGTYIPSYTVTGLLDKVPIIPTKNGYSFDGWYSEKNNTRLYARMPITEDTRFVAHWTKSSYTVKYDSNGGSYVSPISYDEKITSLPTSERQGYSLLGWYTDSGDKAYYGMPLSDDITLTAKWKKIDDSDDEETGDDYYVGDSVYTNDAEYEITNMSSGYETVEFSELLDQSIKNFYTYDSITIDGGEIPYKVTSVGYEACERNGKIRTLTLGSNITSIGVKAFYKCRSLKTIRINSKEIKYIGSKAFSGVKKNAKVYVPASNYKQYKKMLRKAGLSKKAKIIKVYA